MTDTPKFPPQSRVRLTARAHAKLDASIKRSRNPSSLGTVVGYDQRPNELRVTVLWDGAKQFEHVPPSYLESWA